jgi:hypothetical protein
MTVLRNIILTIFIFGMYFIIFNPFQGSSRASNGKIYRASSSKTADVLDFLKTISLDFANKVRVDNPALGLALLSRLVNTTFVELSHDEHPRIWAWNVDKGREIGFRFYKQNGELEKPEEQICSLLHELAHSVVPKYDHEIEWKNVNNYFQNFLYKNERIKDYYIRKLVRDNELYQGISINAVAKCDGS